MHCLHKSLFLPASRDDTSFDVDCTYSSRRVCEAFTRPCRALEIDVKATLLSFFLLPTLAVAICAYLDIYCMRELHWETAAPALIAIY